MSRWDGWASLGFKTVADVQFVEQIARVLGLGFNFATQMPDVNAQVINFVHVFKAPDVF